MNKNQIQIYPPYYHINFEYGYGYPYWCLSGYGYWIFRISIFTLPFLVPACTAFFESCPLHHESMAMEIVAKKGEGLVIGFVYYN